MPLAPLGGIGLGTYGRYPHQTEKRFKTLLVDLDALVLPEPLHHAWHAHLRVQHVLLVDKAHQFQIEHGLSLGSVIKTAAVDIQELALANYAQSRCLVNVPLPFFGTLLHDKAFVKNRFPFFVDQLS